MNDQCDLAEIFDLQLEIEQAMMGRLPELRAFLVRPFQVVAKEENTWVVARSSDTALCISLETERFGVGFLSSDIELTNTDFLPSAELASQAFKWAIEGRA